MSAPASATSFDDYLNEQLINSINLQTNVIQNLSRYSQHISLQLLDIKNDVEILTNQFITLHQQSHFISPIQTYIPPFNPLFFSNVHDFTPESIPFAFPGSTTHEQISRSAPFVFNPIVPSNIIDSDGESSPDDSREDSLSNDDDIILIGEAIPTHEQIELAKRLQLPPTFYLYENKKPCKGCRGCIDDYLIQSENHRNSYDASITAALENLSAFPSAFFPNSALSSIMSMVPTWFPDGADSYSSLNMPPPSRDRRMIVKAKRCLPSNRVPPPPSSYPDYEQTPTGNDREDDTTAALIHQKKSRNFSEKIIGQVKNELYKQNQIVETSQFDNSKPSVEDITPVNNSRFSFGNSGSPDGFQFSTPISSVVTKPSPTFNFRNHAKLSFSDLAKQSSDMKSTFDNNEERVFPGQGSSLFNTEEDNEYEPSYPFKPIVHLSPVEVKTGEEDENIRFREHAKLYRFDETSGERKQRGIGEVKILQHKTTNICRVLMRRDQVFKVCANHRITSQMELKEYPDKENAYIWFAMDLADGVLKPEKLCIRFETNEKAKKFFQHFNDAKQINADIQQ